MLILVLRTVLRRLLTTIFREVAVMVTVGCFAGIVISRLTGPSLAHLLFRTPVMEPMWTVLAVVFLFTISCAAGLMPARHAVRADPAQVLREL